MAVTGRSPGDPRTALIVNPGAGLYGSDRMTVETVKAIVSQGCRVFVAVPEPGPLVELLAAAGATVVVQPTPIVRKGLLSPRGLVQLGREAVHAWRPSRRLIRETAAGTVLVNTITAPLWFPLARLSGRRVACHVHEAEGSLSPLVRVPLYAPLTWCHRIVANSRCTAAVLRRTAPWLARRAHVVHNVVTGPERVVPPRDELTGQIRLAYVGRLSHRKGPHVAVDAVRLLRDRGQHAQLSLAGAVFPGNEAYESALRGQIARADLADNVRFLGFRTSIWETLAEADIVIVPSTGDESFGNAAVEALLAARPLVVSDVDGLREATEFSTARIVVPPADSAAVADAVERIVADWPGYARRAAGDAPTAADQFSFDRYADALTLALGLRTAAPRAHRCR